MILKVLKVKELHRALGGPLAIGSCKSTRPLQLATHYGGTTHTHAPLHRVDRSHIPTAPRPGSRPTSGPSWHLSNCDCGFAFRLPNDKRSQEDYWDDRVVVRDGTVSRLFTPALVGELQPPAGADKIAK